MKIICVIIGFIIGCILGILFNIFHTKYRNNKLIDKYMKGTMIYGGKDKVIASVKSIVGDLNETNCKEIRSLFLKFMKCFKMRKFDDLIFASMLGRFKVMLMTHKYFTEILKDDSMMRDLFTSDINCWIDTKSLFESCNSSVEHCNYIRPGVLYSLDDIYIYNISQFRKKFNDLNSTIKYVKDNINTIDEKYIMKITLNKYNILSNEELNIFYSFTNSIKISYDESIINELSNKFSNFRPMDIINSNDYNFKCVVYSDAFVCIYFINKDDNYARIDYAISNDISEDKYVCYYIDTKNSIRFSSLLKDNGIFKYSLLFLDLQISIASVALLSIS